MSTITTCYLIQHCNQNLNNQYNENKADTDTDSSHLSYCK